jgi:tetratricopeptide (TPR) repeat protein
MPENIQNNLLHPIHKALLIAILLAFGILVYSSTFDSPFVLDDEPFIVKDIAIHMIDLSWDDVKMAAFKGFPAQRYLPNISWAFNYYFGQLNPFGYHLVNLVIHLLSGIFLFFFIKNTLRVYPGKMRDIHPELIAFFAALIWVVQPVGTQSVTYICQRMASMVALFYILSLLLYVRSRMVMRQNPERRLIPALYLIGCALSALCAIATKENAGTLPIIILLYEWFFFQDLKLTWSRRQILWIGFFVIALAGVVFWYMGGNPMTRLLGSYQFRDFSLIERVMTEWRIMIYYISLFVWAPPGRLNLDHDYPLSLSPIDPPTTLIALAAILGLLVLAAYSAKKERLLAFCILWFFITQATESSIIGIELVFEHRTYIPFMMISLLFILAISRLIRNRPMAYALLVAAALVFSVWTYQRNQIWQDPVTFWTDCVTKSPNKWRPQHNLGVALYAAGDITGAISQYETAIRIDPDHSISYNTLGSALLKQGKTDEAVKNFRRALAINPNFVDAYNNLGSALLDQGKIDEALQCFHQALALNPELADVHSNMGNVLLKQSNTGGAIQCFRQALALNPDHIEARNNLANTLMQNGDTHGAINHFQIILKKYPDHVEANINLGAALAHLGQIGDALNHYQTALNSDPNNPEAHNNMGVLLVQSKMFPEALEHFKRALALRPGYESAINNIRRLEQMQK